MKSINEMRGCYADNRALIKNQDWFGEFKSILVRTDETVEQMTDLVYDFILSYPSYAVGNFNTTRLNIAMERPLRKYQTQYSYFSHILDNLRVCCYENYILVATILVRFWEF